MPGFLFSAVKNNFRRAGNDFTGYVAVKSSLEDIIFIAFFIL